jgi:hypothetical protein
MDQVNLYDEELPKIGKVAFEVNYKWKELARHIDISNVKETARKINEFHKYAVDAFETIGFVVEVDTTTIYVDQPPTINVVARVNPIIFDHEKKAYEIRKSK